MLNTTWFKLIEIAHFKKNVKINIKRERIIKICVKNIAPYDFFPNKGNTSHGSLSSTDKLHSITFSF